MIHKRSNLYITAPYHGPFRVWLPWPSFHYSCPWPSRDCPLICLLSLTLSPGLHFFCYIFILLPVFHLLFSLVSSISSVIQGHPLSKLWKVLPSPAHPCAAPRFCGHLTDLRMGSNHLIVPDFLPPVSWLWGQSPLSPAACSTWNTSKARVSVMNICRDPAGASITTFSFLLFVLLCFSSCLAPFRSKGQGTYSLGIL